MKIRSWLEDQRHLFWVLHLGGWAAWGLIGKYGLTRAMLGEVAPHYAAYVGVITVIGIVLTLGLRILYHRVWKSPLWVQAITFLGGSYLAGYAWMRCRGYIYYNWLETAKDVEAWMERLGDAAEVYQKVSFVESHLSGLSVMLAWSALYFAIKYYRIFQEVRESALKSAAMAHEAQLKMLRYQLNPHFLFNTLNAISTLILEQQTELANRMVTRLSSFLRYSLDNDPMLKITLKQELKALQLYLDIEKVRFEERLNLELMIDDDAQDALIPSLLLQPLVENSIKYGIARAEDGGTIRIGAKVFAGDLLIQLSDDGPGVDLVDGEIPEAKGVGLRNTRERLFELYGSQHSFRLSETDPHGLTISIRIPCEKR
ncbi:sensor histidine kinase [Elongatibacter sediminis]|uniref:Histidine kinase n=1 Tax=Elongatibacter sediminis TaxID=3119006 RepID=A0AAW9RF90_9GAMM